jgi:hypothetical protein
MTCVHADHSCLNVEGLDLLAMSVEADMSCNDITESVQTGLAKSLYAWKMAVQQKFSGRQEWFGE